MAKAPELSLRILIFCAQNVSHRPPFPVWNRRTLWSGVWIQWYRILSIHSKKQSAQQPTPTAFTATPGREGESNDAAMQNPFTFVGRSLAVYVCVSLRCVMFHMIYAICHSNTSGVSGGWTCSDARWSLISIIIIYSKRRWRRRRRRQ